jgi:flagellar biosynthetic protein FliP
MKAFYAKRWVVSSLLLAAALLAVASAPAAAVPLPLPSFQIGVEEARTPEEVAVVLQIIALLTVLSLAPAILVLMTSFTRLVVVFNFLRQAIGVQQAPPNQVLIGLALFITFFVMAPVWQQVHQTALRPYLDKEISYQQAFESAQAPVRKFMLANTREKDLALFVTVSGAERPRTRTDVGMLALIPAFVISELKTAFIIGFVLYVPFLVIDMVVASVLLSMGMMMLPPVMISLPFKLMLFVLVDGWNIVIGSLVKSFGVV